LIFKVIYCENQVDEMWIRKIKWCGKSKDYVIKDMAEVMSFPAITPSLLKEKITYL